eukprot:346804-Pelagomonas_calceolata.AAC.2
MDAVLQNVAQPATSERHGRACQVNRAGIYRLCSPNIWKEGNYMHGEHRYTDCQIALFVTDSSTI